MKIATILPLAALIAAASAHLVTAQETDDRPLAVDPERVDVRVDPLDAVIGSLPPMAPLEFESPSPDVVSSPPALPVQDLAPPVVPRETIVVGDFANTTNQVFFNATLGGGSVSSVLGSINVYRLGDGPQFRLGYDHSGADGFQFNEPGSGFFVQENTLDTWLRFGREDGASLEIEGRYEDRRYGLQGRPLFYSADTRGLEGRVGTSWEWGTRSSAGVEATLSDRRRVLASLDSDTDSPEESHRLVVGDVFGRLEWPRLRLETSADYEGRFDEGATVDPSSSVGLTLAVEGVPRDGLTVSAQGSTRYRFFDAPYFPAEAGVAYRGNEWWEIALAGGYRVTDRSYASLWSAYPVATAPGGSSDQLPLHESWFAHGDLEIRVIPGVLGASAGLMWSDEENTLTVDPYDSATGVFPIVVEDTERMDSDATLSVSVGERVGIEGGWFARWNDRMLGEAEHEITGLVRVEWERVSSELGVRFPIDGELIAPVVETEVSYELSRGVEVRLYARDLLGPLLDDGRTPRGVEVSAADPFIDPGLQAGLAVRVSF